MADVILKDIVTKSVLKLCLKSSVIAIAWNVLPIFTILTFGDVFFRNNYDLILVGIFFLAFFTLVLLSWKLFLLKKHFTYNSNLFLEFVELDVQEKYDIIDTISYFRKPDIGNRNKP